MRGASNPYTSGSDGSKQRPSGLGEKIKGSGGANAGDRSSIAVERPLRLISRAVGSRILIKKDIPGRAGADRPSKQQLLKMNKCGRLSVRLRMAGAGREGAAPSRLVQRPGSPGRRRKLAEPRRLRRNRPLSTNCPAWGGGVKDPAFLPQTQAGGWVPTVGQPALHGPTHGQLTDSIGREVRQCLVSTMWTRMCWAPCSAGSSFLIVK